MSDYDITGGGRRRIVSEDQAANLREIAEQRALLEQHIAEHGNVCTADRGVTAERYRRNAAIWDELGEGSQDPAWT